MTDFSEGADPLVMEAVDSEPEAGEGEEEFESDPKRLVARQKQIDYGKNTIGYENYIKAVPKERRKKYGRDHDPPTPDITKKYSKKAWDGIVKAWRRHLHKYDDYKQDQQQHKAVPAEQTANDDVAMQQAGKGASSRAFPSYQHSSWHHEASRSHGTSRNDQYRQQQPPGSSMYYSRHRESELQEGDHYRPCSDRGSMGYRLNREGNSHSDGIQQQGNSRTHSSHQHRGGPAGQSHSKNNREGGRRDRYDVNREDRTQQQRQQKVSQQCAAETVSWADEVDKAEAAGQISMTGGRHCGGGGCAAAVDDGHLDKKHNRSSRHQQLTPAKRSSIQYEIDKRSLKPFQ